MNKAQEFTLQYFDALIDILHIENISEGKPTFIPDHINEFTIMRLHEAIHDLYESRLKDDGLGDLRSYSEKDSITKIQTTGIGFAPNFDLMIKMGLLLGHRLVLWDTMIPGIVFSKSINLTQLGRVVCELLQTYPIVQQGGLVYLPHPANWSDPYKFISKSFQDRTDITTDELGFINARALAKDGYPLHPFFSKKVNKSIDGLCDKLASDSEYYGNEKLSQHDILRDFLTDPRFLYIDNVKPTDFYEILCALDKDESGNGIREKLADSLTISNDLSPIEKERKRKQALIKLANLVPEQNKGIFKKALFKYGSAAKAIGAGLAVLGSVLVMADASTATAIIGTIGGSLGATGTILALIEKKLGKQDENILYQFFTELSASAEQQYLKELENEFQMNR